MISTLPTYAIALLCLFLGLLCSCVLGGILAVINNDEDDEGKD